jgi:hypothetical protein
MRVRGLDRPDGSDPAGTGDARNRPRFTWRNVDVFVGLLLVREETVDQPQACVAAGLTPPTAPASSEATPALVGAT